MHEGAWLDLLEGARRELWGLIGFVDGDGEGASDLAGGDESVVGDDMNDVLSRPVAFAWGSEQSVVSGVDGHAGWMVVGIESEADDLIVVGCRCGEG